jgi:hypothetical protein
MSGAPRRDPLSDHLITPQNSALILIDYQPFTAVPVLLTRGADDIVTP